MADVELSQRAAEWLRTADPSVTEQITKRLELAKDFPDHYLTRLRSSSYHKLRAGDYRAIIEWRRDSDILFVREIGHRDNIYE